MACYPSRKPQYKQNRQLRSLNARTLRSQAMAPIWPFNRKKSGAPKAKPAEEKKVVSYEREQGDAQKEKLEDRTHLEDKGFKDAMKLLDGS